MKQFFAVIRYALDHRPALLAAMLLPVLVTMLVAVAAPTVPTIAAAAVALPAAMVAWGGGVLAGKLHEQESTSLGATMGERTAERTSGERPGGPPTNDENERRKRAA